MTRIVLGLITALTLISCSEKKDKKSQSNNPVIANQSFFYPYDTVPKYINTERLKTACMSIS